MLRDSDEAQVAYREEEICHKIFSGAIFPETINSGKARPKKTD